MADALGYQFANLHAGLEFGNESSAFFLHGGMSYIHSKLHHVNDALNSNTASGSNTVISVGSDPRISVWVPSIKLGFILYLV